MKGDNIKWILLFSTLLLVVIAGGIYYISKTLCENKIQSVIDAGKITSFKLDSIVMSEIEVRKRLIDSISILTAKSEVLKAQIDKKEQEYALRLKRVKDALVKSDTSNSKLKLFFEEYEKSKGN